MTAPATRLVPYITAREGEEADSLLSLRADFSSDGQSRLGYWDESAQDRDTRGVLWGRCSQMIGPDGLPAGQPRWRLVHPARQRECMLLLRCQLCVGPAKTPDGHLFLERACGPAYGAVVRTAQPPVCLKHAPVAAEQFPYLAGHGVTAFLVRSAPLYGVIGTAYEYGSDGIRAVAASDEPVRYGRRELSWFLASQLVRTLRDYSIVNLDDLLREVGAQ
ncbi:hypothetical protein [Streptomyces sp. NBC_00829]|uniref:hypothetical protein n=1 Tax=Streptomyces sp. NBC_00829 TaxID=2903679 RepID=UPI002F91386C|nr:hypothetical protein OG293_41090 [Streptomyces sp. NBC_00829]